MILVASFLSSIWERTTLPDVFLKDSSKQALRLCAKLTDIEQGEKETAGKFLDNLCKFTDVDPKSTEEEWS